MWEEPPIDDEPYDDLPPDADLVLIDEDLPVEVAPASETLEEVEVVAYEEPPILAEEISAETASPAPAAVEDADADSPEVPVSVDDRPAVFPAPGETVRPEVVVDLDHLHVEPPSLEPDLELLFAGAPPPEGEKSGLLGAVRSAFARNKTSHEHEFVEAPGGIGIVRQICADCGYISIGVSD